MNYLIIVTKSIILKIYVEYKMIFANFVLFLFFIYKISFYLVLGQNVEKNDCTKYFNYVRGDNKIYTMSDCCNDSLNRTKCDANNEYIYFIDG